MLYFKLIEKVDDFVRGPVLSTALAGGTTEDHRVTFEKALDLEPFTYTKPIRKMVTGQQLKIDVVLNTSTIEGAAALDNLEDAILLGPTDTHLKFDVGSSPFKVYDAVTNRVITDYTISSTNPNHILIGADDIKDRVLMYRTANGTNGFCKFEQAFVDYSVTYSNNQLVITLTDGGTAFPDDTAVDIMFNPYLKPEIKLVGGDFYKPWKIQAKTTASLGKGMFISNVSATANGTTDKVRPKVISNEKVKMLSPYIIKTENKNIILNGAYAVNTRTYSANGFICLYDENDMFIDIASSIEDIWEEEGLIFLDKSLAGHSKLRIDYTVSDTAWIESESINFNPLFNRLNNGLEPIEQQYYDKIELWYSRSTSGLYFSINDTSSTKFEFQTGEESTLTDFLKIGHFILNTKEPNFLDIRTEGGKLIEKNTSDSLGPIYDIRSHMTFGFMGESPEQNNIVVAGIGVNILKQILTSYDVRAAVDFETTYSHAIGSGTNAEFIEYIENYEDSITFENTLKNELQASVERYLPMGIIYIFKIANSSDIIFSNTDNSSFETDIAGEYE